MDLPAYPLGQKATSFVEAAPSPGPGSRTQRQPPGHLSVQITSRGASKARGRACERVCRWLLASSRCARREGALGSGTSEWGRTGRGPPPKRPHNLRVWVLWGGGEGGGVGRWPCQGPSKAILQPRTGASLVAQWLRIRLPMQGTRARALVQEDPTCRGAAKPVRQNY